MNKIFLAFPFNPKGGKVVQDLVKNIGRLVASHGLVAVTGEVLGGNALTPAVQRKIAECDALIALFTREKKVAGKDAWLPTQWVQSELTLARARNQPAVALVESRVETAGLYGENEHIPLDLKKTTDALLQLSENIGEWKAQAGRFLLIRLLPEAAAALVSNGPARCQVRLVPPQGPAGQWQNAAVRTRPGGVFLAVPGVKEDVSIDVEIIDQANIPRWKSGEFPQWVHVEMRSVA